MNGWVDYLHLGFLGEHVLFPFLRLQSFSSFILIALVISIICLSERFLTVVLSKNVQPNSLRRSRLATTAWRSSVYGCLTLLRLLYMLIAMSYQLGAIAIVVIMLSLGQFVIEYFEYQEPILDGQVEEPLLGNSAIGGPRHTWRPVKKSKPENIFIHPYESNLARADAVALELGIGSDTKLVQGNNADGTSWQLGRGREAAREAFGHPHCNRRLISRTEEVGRADNDGEVGVSGALDDPRGTGCQPIQTKTPVSK